MAKAQTRGRSSGLGFFFVLLLLVLGATGALGTIFVLGGKLPFLGRVEAQDKDKADHPGQVKVPIATRLIPAYTLVEWSTIFDERTKSFSYSYMSPEKVKDLGTISDMSDLFGRVTARDKQPGYTFTEADFLPKGTRPGPAAGIDAGMRGIRVSTRQVQGLSNLKRGDRFDLMAMRPDNSPAQAGSGVYVDPSAAAKGADAKRWDAPSRIIVQNGKIIDPLPPSNSGPGADEVFIGVKEEEVEALTGAIDLGAKITGLTRSGQPGGENGALPIPEGAPQLDGIKVFNGVTPGVAVPGTDDKVDKLEHGKSKDRQANAAANTPKK